MKNIILIIFFTLISTLTSCQTVVDLDARDGTRNNGIYYKDTNNKLLPFGGTWVYNDGTNYIKLILVNKIYAQIGDYYEDLIIGEFQYKHNGIDIINNLNNLNVTYPNILQHSISGNYFLTTQTPFDQYTNDNFRLGLMINENACPSRLEIRTLILNGQPAIQIYKWKSLETATGCHPTIPEGFYYLIKQ